MTAIGWNTPFGKTPLFRGIVMLGTTTMLATIGMLPPVPNRYPNVRNSAG